MPYKFNPFVYELPTRCDLCPKTLTGNGVKLRLDGKYEQNFHENCAEKVKKLIEKGHVFIQKLPLILLVEQTEDGFIILNDDKQENFFTLEALEKNFRIFKPE